MTQNVYTAILALSVAVWSVALLAHYLEKSYVKKKDLKDAIQKYVDRVSTNSVQSVSLGESETDDHATSPTSAKGK